MSHARVVGTTWLEIFTLRNIAWVITHNIAIDLMSSYNL